MKLIKKQRLTKEDSEIKKIKTLYKTSKAMNSVVGLKQLLDLILKSACETVMGDSGSIMFPDEKTKKLKIMTSIGLNKDTAKIIKVKVEKRISGHTGQDKMPLFLVGRLGSGQEVKSALCIPLKIKNRLIGVLNVNSTKSSCFFNNPGLELLTLLAEDAAVVVENAKTYEELSREKSYTDNVIETMIDSLIVLNPGGKIKTVNRAAGKLLGCTKDELIGKPARVIFEEKLFNPQSLKKLIKEDYITNYRTDCKTKTGEKIPIVLSGSVMKNRKKKLEGIVIITREVAGRKKAAV